MNASDRPPDESAAHDHSTSIGRLVTAALGLIIVGGSIGWMIYSALASEVDAPPDIVVTYDSLIHQRDRYLLIYRVENRGGSAVADLEIEASGGDSATGIETIHAAVGYVPAGSERRGGLYFTRDPRRGPIRLRPLGFAEP